MFCFPPLVPLTLACAWRLDEFRLLTRTPLYSIVRQSVYIYIPSLSATCVAGWKVTSYDFLSRPGAKDVCVCVCVCVSRPFCVCLPASGSVGHGPPNCKRSYEIDRYIVLGETKQPASFPVLRLRTCQPYCANANSFSMCTPEMEKKERTGRRLSFGQLIFGQTLGSRSRRIQQTFQKQRFKLFPSPPLPTLLFLSSSPASSIRSSTRG